MDETPGSGAAEGSTTLVAIAISLLRHRRLIFGVALVFALVVLALLMARRPTYTSDATFAPQSRKGANSFGGLAAQLGVSVPGAETDQSPAFYVDLIASRAILGRIVDSPLVVTPGQTGRGQSVAELLGVRVQSPTLRRSEAINRLSRVVRSGFSQKTGVVSVSATAPQPGAARDLVERIIDAVSQFNLVNRQSRASAERKFTEQRLAEAQAELRAAEGRAQEFLQRNREYRNAPQLSFEFDRLTREIGLRQQLYNSLAQALDQAKIDEVRDTPVITLIDRAEVPVRPDPRGLIRWPVVAFIVGALIGSVLAMLLDYLASHERDSDALHEFGELREQAAQDIRRPWRVLRSQTKG